MDISQLLSPTEAAHAKDMSLNQFKYHIAKPNAPKPFIVGNAHPFYDREQIRLWKPSRMVKKRKNTREGVTAGETANLGVKS